MSQPTPPKKRLFEQFSRVAKALASPSRLELLEALAQGERGVEGLAHASGLSVANTSHHLQNLREGGLVRSRKEGLQVIYSLSGAEVLRLISAMRLVAETHLAEVDRIVRDNFDNKDSLQPVKRDELMNLVRDGEAMVIDVRPPAEYAAGHIDGAINIPLTSLSDHLDQLPIEQEIVAYCRGPYCMFAFDAVTQLRKHGYRARRLEDGYPEWEADNLPTTPAKLV